MTTAEFWQGAMRRRAGEEPLTERLRDAFRALAEPAVVLDRNGRVMGRQDGRAGHLLLLYAAVVVLCAAILMVHVVGLDRGGETVPPAPRSQVQEPANIPAPAPIPDTGGGTTTERIDERSPDWDFGNDSIGRTPAEETLGLEENTESRIVPETDPGEDEEETRIAALPRAPEAAALLPTWRQNAVAPPPIAGRPMIALIIDDLGNNQTMLERILGIGHPLTLSFLPYAEGVAAQVQRARQAGFEIMAHIPMEPVLPLDPGPNALLAGLSLSEFRKRLAWNLEQFDGYVGVNNHMGSLLTQDQDAMTVVMDELSQRGLMFVDSRTSGRSVAGPLARRMGLANVDRDVFIDDKDEEAEIRAQLEILERKARQYGSAVAIAHPRPLTLDILEEWLDTLDEKGFVIVPVTTVVKSLVG